MRSIRSLPFLLALSLLAATPPTFPRHWGNPPAIQTRDMRPLPGGYGHGSTTLANWIQKNLDRDATGKVEPPEAVVARGVTVRGELRQGRRVTLAIESPAARLDRVTVRLRHESGQPDDDIEIEPPSGPPRSVPHWVAQFTPEKAGEWTIRVTFRESRAPGARAIERSGRISIAPAR